MSRFGFGFITAIASAAIEHTVTFLNEGTAGTPGATSYNVSLDLGTANAGDKIVGCAAGQRWGGVGDITSMTIDGQPAEIIGKATTANSIITMWYVDDEDGVMGGNPSTINIVSTGSGGYVWRIGAIRLAGSKPGPPADTDVNSVSNDTMDTNVDIADGGIVISVAGAGGGPGPTTWSNIDKHSDATLSGQVYQTIASRKYLSASAAQLIRAAMGSQNTNGMVTAAFAKDDRIREGFIATDSGNSAGWGTGLYTIRQRVLAAGLAVPSGAITGVRLKYKASTAEGCTMAEAYIGHKAASGNPYDTGTLVQQTFSGGSPGFSIPASGEIVGDFVPFVWDEVSDIIFTMRMEDGAADAMRKDETAGANFISYWKLATDEAAVAVASGGYDASANRLDGVFELEFRVA